MVPWVLLSRSAASGWPRRSTASCCGRPGCSAGTRSSAARSPRLAEFPRPARPGAGGSRCRSGARDEPAAGRPAGRSAVDGPGERPPAAGPAERPAAAIHQDRWREWAAGAAEFARQRLAGEFQTDETGFDPHFHAHVIMPLTRALYRNWFRVQMRGAGARAGRGRARWSWPTTPACSRSTRSCCRPGCSTSTRSTATSGCSAPTWSTPSPGWPPWPVKSGHTRADPAEAARAAGRRRAGRRVPRGVQGHRQAVPRALPAAALRPGRVRGHRHRGRRADRALRDRRRRGDLSNDRECQAAGQSCSACRTSRSPRCSPGSGPLGAVPLPSNWIIEFCPPVPTDDYRPVGRGRRR